MDTATTGSVRWVTHPWPTWQEAWRHALYGPGQFYRRESPAAHFRTSVHTSPLFADAIVRLAGQVRAETVVDIGAGRGELLRRLSETAPELELIGVEVAARPRSLPDQIGWLTEPPQQVDGLVIANEWLDNVPCEVVEYAEDGRVRVVHVDPVTGAEALGDPPSEEDQRWLDGWWPLAEPGRRAEVGLSRDRAWAELAARVGCGLAVAIDYGHTMESRPTFGSLRSYQVGREVEPRPDGTRDVTAHVSFDSLIHAGGGVLTSQRSALRSLGVRGDRPPLDQASTDPVGYVRALSAATQAAELTAEHGLGAFGWVLHVKGVELPMLARSHRAG
jgi:SAM-dependent MidA family methyltransferase